MDITNSREIKVKYLQTIINSNIFSKLIFQRRNHIIAILTLLTVFAIAAQARAVYAPACAARAPARAVHALACDAHALHGLLS